MYEAEVNHKVEQGDEIPSEILRHFGEANEEILARTVLPWSEHCTECAWPTCYKTCDLYSPREDGRCRRFADGMVRVECSSALNSYLLKVKFKRWGKLWSPANVRLYSLSEANTRELNDYRIGTVLYYLPVPSGVKALATGQRYRFKKKVGGQPITGGELPTSFLCECYNPSPRTVALSLTLRSANEAIKIHFQRLIELTPGFHRVRVPMTKIMPVIDIRKPFNIELIPNDVEETTTLYFGTIEFVREVDQAPSRETKIKCVVWDLDNTLWDGILIEDGAGKLTLKPGVIDVIRSLDERGILQSIASKNSHDEAMQILKQFQIEEFFLCPQISWRPKSESIGLIAQQLNIGEDSLLFVDDSQFELDQVKAVRPQVRIMNALEYRTLPEVEACQVQVTAESRERRRMYQVEAARQNMAEGFGSDYKTFLRHCNIQLVLRPMTEENLDRVHELTQRTNQMNFSGVRYDRDVLRSIAADSSLDTYVISCEDRFGSYGIVGFSVIDSREPRMTDLMFSCRVQAKRIEHAFLGHVIRRYASNSGGDFFANYRKTARNAPSGQVFDDLGMEEIVTKDGVTSLVFRRDKTAPDDQVVQIADLVLSAEAT